MSVQTSDALVIYQLTLFAQPTIDLEYTPLLMPPGQLLNPACQRFIFVFDDYWLDKGIAAETHPTTSFALTNLFLINQPSD